MKSNLNDNTTTSTNTKKTDIYEDDIYEKGFEILMFLNKELKNLGNGTDIPEYVEKRELSNLLSKRNKALDNKSLEMEIKNMTSYFTYKKLSSFIGIFLTLNSFLSRETSYQNEGNMVNAKKIEFLINKYESLYLYRKGAMIFAVFNYRLLELENLTNNSPTISHKDLLNLISKEDPYFEKKSLKQEIELMVANCTGKEKVKGLLALFTEINDFLDQENEQEEVTKISKLQNILKAKINISFGDNYLFTRKKRLQEQEKRDKAYKDSIKTEFDKKADEFITNFYANQNLHPIISLDEDISALNESFQSLIKKYNKSQLSDTSPLNGLVILQAQYIKEVDSNLNYIDDAKEFLKEYKKNNIDNALTKKLSSIVKCEENLLELGKETVKYKEHLIELDPNYLVLLNEEIKTKRKGSLDKKLNDRDDNLCSINTDNNDKNIDVIIDSIQTKLKEIKINNSALNEDERILIYGLKGEDSNTNNGFRRGDYKNWYSSAQIICLLKKTIEENKNKNIAIMGVTTSNVKSITSGDFMKFTENPDSIIIPLNYAGTNTEVGTHFYCIRIHKPNDKGEVYYEIIDSLNPNRSSTKKEKDIVDKACEVFSKISHVWNKKESLNQYEFTSNPQQTDSHSCGPLMVRNIRKLLDNPEPLVEKSNDFLELQKDETVDAIRIEQLKEINDFLELQKDKTVDEPLKEIKDLETTSIITVEEQVLESNAESKVEHKNILSKTSPHSSPKMTIYLSLNDAFSSIIENKKNKKENTEFVR